MAGLAGFEPTNDGIKNRCLTTWRQPNAVLTSYGAYGALGEIRTHDPCLRRAILYPAELQVHACFYTVFCYKNKVLLIHTFEKLCIVFGLTQFFHQELHRVCHAHWH